MKKIGTFLLIIVVSIFVQTISIFPWWSFLLPIFFIGIILPLEKWKIHAFLYGFFAGFLVWTLSTLYFEAHYNCTILHAISKMFSVSIYVLYGFIGLIGGILSGLALYSGFLLMRGKEIVSL
jgi:hypothetical protein